MKIAYVEISGFRGFRERTRFEFPAGFAVLSGRNGSGKSTALDAVDYALTGTINKFAVRGAKGGGVDNHIWWVGAGQANAYFVDVGFKDDEGREFSVRRTRERGLEKDFSSLQTRLCVGDGYPDSWAETLMQTTLIRDETLSSLSLDLPEQARFAAVRAAIGGLAGPDHSERTGEILRNANAIREEQRNKLEQIESELGRALSALTEARSIADKQADVTEAERLIRELAPNVSGDVMERAEQLRRLIAARKQALPALTDAINRGDKIRADQEYFLSEVGQSEISSTTKLLEDARSKQSEAALKLAEAEKASLAERDADEFASHVVSLLDHGESVGLIDGHCPLCDAARNNEEFQSAIASARSRLEKRGERIRAAQKKLDTARAEAARAQETLSAADHTLRLLVERRDALSKELAAIDGVLASNEMPPYSVNADAAREAVMRRQDETVRLEGALFILESSGAHDRVLALESRIQNFRQQIEKERAKLTACERACDTAKQIDSAAKSAANEILTEQFDTVMPLLKELYSRLRPHTDWREIETDFGGKVRASLNFSVGDGWNPQFLFSSGQRRAAGLAFLLSIHLSRPWCTLRSLLLDDPVQHIDDYRALNLVEVLAAVRRSGRQVLIAVEDPALADLLCRRLRSSATEAGKRFDLCTDITGSSNIEREQDISPLPRDTLRSVA